MIEPTAFVALWKDKLVKPDPASLKTSGIPAESVQFLTVAGLPSGCAPFLSFDPLARGLRSINEVFFIPGELKEQEVKRLSVYKIIGHDGAGNPICLDMSNLGQVVLPDHENFFRSEMFVNTSIPQLAECLLA